MTPFPEITLRIPGPVPPTTLNDEPALMSIPMLDIRQPRGPERRQTDDVVVRSCCYSIPRCRSRSRAVTLPETTFRPANGGITHLVARRPALDRDAGCIRVRHRVPERARRVRADEATDDPVPLSLHVRTGRSGGEG